MYPEYRKKIKDAYKAPEKCERNCVLGNVGAAPNGAPPQPPAAPTALQPPNR
jgi:hypothetical protein